MPKLEVKPVFVRNDNVRNFEALMEGLEHSAGEGRLAVVYGRAGRGKTRTAQWWHANHANTVYLHVLKIWRTSELNFLQALCRELGNPAPPGRKNACYDEVINGLLARKSPAVFLDEIEKLPPDTFLEIVRDLTDDTGSPFVLIGEEELYGLISNQRRRRLWSRVFEQQQFHPLTVTDITGYARDAAGVKLESEPAGIFHEASGGDFRIVKRDFSTAVRMANAKRLGEITADIAKAAVKAGVRA